MWRAEILKGRLFFFDWQLLNDNQKKEQEGKKREYLQGEVSAEPQSATTTEVREKGEGKLKAHLLRSTAGTRLQHKVSTIRENYTPSLTTLASLYSPFLLFRILLM